MQRIQPFRLAAIAVIFSFSTAGAQDPELKIDLDFHGRKTAEVNAPGYRSWAISESKTESIAFGDVRFTLKGTLSSDWYKAGVQPPVLARLVNDGLLADSLLEMQITGLPAGKHTLLTFHNTFADPEKNDFSPIDIYVNGKLVVADLQPSNRAGSAAAAASAYLELEAIAGQPVVLHFKTDSDAAVILNGMELNTPDIVLQSGLPVPADRDEHAAAENGLRLRWSKGKGAVSHEIYLGTDSAEVARAGNSSPSYKGNQQDTTFQTRGLYSMLTYYWRVDEKDARGNITRGDVWQFRPRQLAFPGAEGHGRFARGGRGGTVVRVSNLNDSGPGSLREAVEDHDGPRTIVFAVSGIIELESRLVINDRYVTIAGQTAPGKGITIRGAPVGLTGDDGIIRFLRVRVGAGRTFDGMGLTGADNSIIDHCSISWTIDEAFSSRGAHHISLQRTLISEALNVAGHNKYERGKMHGYAASIGGDIGSFHHNLLAHCYGRNWSLAGGMDGNGRYTGRLDIRNNVVYNWGKRTTDGGAHQVNFVNNYYKPGPATVFFYALKAQHEGYGGGRQQYYFKGNVMPGHFNEHNQHKGRIIEGRASYDTYVDSAFFPSHVRTQTAVEAYKNVLSDVGCSLPVLDAHDTRIIRETLSGSYTYKGSISGLPGIPDTQDDVGGWETYPGTRRDDDWDSDRDGLPDWWEMLAGLDPNGKAGDFSDTNADPNRDGFTNLDRYLAWMAGPHFTGKPGETVEIELKQLFRGFTGALIYSVSGDKYGLVSLDAERGILRFSPGETASGRNPEGGEPGPGKSEAGEPKAGKPEAGDPVGSPALTTITVSVQDAAGSSMSREIGLRTMP